MKRLYTLLTISSLLFLGCGGNDVSTNSTKPSKINSSSGKIDGKYNLWSYMVPSHNRVSKFLEEKGNKSLRYQTTYSVTKDKVIEASDYAPNEKTIYEKKSDRIKVTFKKDGTENGSYDLDLTADIGDIVTIKESPCKLVKHYDTLKVKDKSFNDVIEIDCRNKPGYYQNGIGEIAQTNAVTENGTRAVRVLSN